jgi:2',3'-cyclic-nucleotide 2'-phosphodiesterase (5'-nucleotidase family)
VVLIAKSRSSSHPVVAAALLVGLAVSLTACGGSDGAPAAASLPESATAQLTVLETTDLHFNVRSYDYFKLAEDKSYGLERTATLVKQASARIRQQPAGGQRRHHPGHRAGRLPTGQPAGHHQPHPLHAAAVASHRHQVTWRAGHLGPAFPLVLANVSSKKDGATLYKPYTILSKKVSAKDKDGKTIESTVKVAVIGFAPPPILLWDKRWLDGKVDVQGVVESATKYVPMARAEGADIVIAASHGGIKASLPQYAALPVLSVSAPFKSGFQGGADYTDVAVGPLAINNAADLYLYPNTVYAVKVNGGDIKNWLEAAAKRFNQIDPAKTTEQQLISTFPGYNFDMFTTADVQYEIDVTQPVGSRIKNLTYLGKPSTWRRSS